MNRNIRKVKFNGTSNPNKISLKQKIIYLAIGTVSTIVITIFAIILTSLIPITESNIKMIESEYKDQFEFVKVDVKEVTLHGIEYIDFRNYGLKRGFIQHINIERADLAEKPELKLLHLNKEPISFLATKKIVLEYLLIIKNPMLNNNYKYRIYFYDNKGNQVYYKEENIRLKKVD